MDPSSLPKAYHFGPFILDMKGRLLCLDATSIPLTQKEFLTLTLLVEAAGRAVSRESLIRTIWPDTTVGDTSLGRNISVLRRHLGSDSIQSIPKFGYRFSIPVTVVRDSPAQVSPDSAPAAGPSVSTAAAAAGESAKRTSPSGVALGTSGEPAHEAALPQPFVEPERAAPAIAQPERLASAPGGLRTPVPAGRGLGAAGLLLLTLLAAGGGWTLRRRRAPPTSPAAVSAAAVIRLAVLPFHNTSPHPQETDYLRDGFDDELTARLGAFQPRQLRVLARGTTRQYLDSSKPPPVIAAESGAHFLLEGSIGFTAGRAQIMASLVNPADQTIVWSRTFAGRLDELEAFESEITEAVGSNLDLPHPVPSRRAKTPAAGRVSPAAYDEYLRGRFELESKTLDGYRRALNHFQTASTLDPKYASAWSGIAESYIFMGGIIPMNECYRRARVADIKAIQLDPELGEAHRDLAYILMNDERDLAGAEREYKRAIELNLDDARAHHWYAQLLAAERRNAESIAEATAGYQLDPRSVGSGSNYGFMLIAAGEPGQGVTVLEELTRREPAVDYAWGYLGFGYLRLKQFERAAAAFDRAASLGTLKVNYSSCAAFARARSGNVAAAAGMLAELENMQRAGKWVPAQSMAIVYLALGRRKEAGEWLLKGVEDRTTTLFEANTEPVYSEMKDDPGFPQLLARLQKAQ